MCDDLYGLTVDSLEKARATIEASLGVFFEPHESSYRGGDYFLFKRGDSMRLTLQENFIDPFDGELFEPEYEKYSFLLYVEGSESVDEIRKKLQGNDKVVFLQRELVSRPSVRR